MKNTITILCGLTVLILSACNPTVKRKPGSHYMPDMAYSRAYETYSDHSNLKDKGINYNALPVKGTISRDGDEYIFELEKDSVGVFTNYEASAAIPNPVTSLTPEQMIETERLYQINCGICHGAKLDGNGPLWKDGTGPYPAKPATLVGDPLYEGMAAGTMFYSVTYGRNLMGSYASQLTPTERWNIIYFIKQKQSGVATPTATDSTAAPAAGVDTTAAAVAAN